jgi:AcrR family transcriptional regulator
MAPDERRQRDGQNTKERILDAAREVFAHEGYESVTMRRIAEKVGLSATALYVHFADKRALLRELCAIDFLALRAQFGDIAQIADPIERLRRAGEAYVEFGLRSPNHYRVMFMTPGVETELEPAELPIEKGNPDQDAYAFLRQVVGDAIAQGRLRPELQDVDLVGQLCWSSVHGVVSLSITMQGSKWCELRPPAELARLAGDVLVRGIERERPAKEE